MFANNGESGDALRAAPALVLVPGRSMMPAPVVDFFHRRLEPHLDQLQQMPIADATRDSDFMSSSCGMLSK